MEAKQVQPTKTQANDAIGKRIRFPHEGSLKQGRCFGQVTLTLLQVTTEGGKVVLVPPANAKVLN
jgi:hypothetical protein